MELRAVGRLLICGDAVQERSARAAHLYRWVGLDNVSRRVLMQVRANHRFPNAIEGPRPRSCLRTIMSRTALGCRRGRGGAAGHREDRRPSGQRSTWSPQHTSPLCRPVAGSACGP